MTRFRNPFRIRASEYHRDPVEFVRTFGPGALDLLPENAWERLVILRSAPGGGKTSLMRLFTAETLLWLHRRNDRTDELDQRLRDIGVLSDRGPAVLGVHVNLHRDFRALAEIATSKLQRQWSLFRLLDARILAGVVRASLQLRGLQFPADASRVDFIAGERDLAASVLVDHVGGPKGSDIVEWAQEIERVTLDELDALLPTSTEDRDNGRHHSLLSLRLLSDVEITVDSQPLEVRPLIMLDDGHELHPDQRSTLLAALIDREVQIPRWYAERYEAMSADELLSELGASGRDFEVVLFESAVREVRGDAPRGFARARFNRMLIDIGNRRAARLLEREGDERRNFFELLDAVPENILDDRQDEIISELHARLKDAAGDDPRYKSWLARAQDAAGWNGAIMLRELEILVLRDRNRRQGELFEEVLTDEEAQARSGSALREAAALDVGREFRLPYLSGPDVVPKLATANIEQFLRLCGDVFEEMLVDMSVGRRPLIAPSRQHRVLMRAAEDYWRQIPRRLPHGRDVQTLTAAVVAIAQRENAKPTVPYAPGVTGTALTMRDRERLRDATIREQVPGAQRLHDALSSAIAHNVVWAELDRRVKNQRFMVVYLNRLLCARFGLPLGLGGFRERSLERMAEWLTVRPGSTKGTEGEALALKL